MSAPLHRALLSPALEPVPREVKRLVIVPDGVLHRLPFEALRESPEDPTLAERFEISYVPSVTLWLRWNRTPRTTSAGRVLTLVDPRLSATGESAERLASGSWTEGFRAGPLPHAMDEARALLRFLGDGTLKTGEAATEEYLKRTDLSRYGVLHLGAHAVIDESRPQRSAVVLAPGSGDDDGLLQVHEILELDLQNKIVILAGCRSARGELLDGEGVLGLAHAFFQSGARVVVGTLWPVRDDETAKLVEEFARQLGRGQPVAAAMAEARRVRIRAGVPAQAWAGLVVLGDGELVLSAETSVLPGAALWGLLLLVVLGTARLLHRRSTRRWKSDTSWFPL